MFPRVSHSTSVVDNLGGVSDTNDGMSVRHIERTGHDDHADLIGRIEERIDQLVTRFAAPPEDGRVPSDCDALVAAASKQAVVSSQGGKRLRALLALTVFDALARTPALSPNPAPANRQAMLDLACAIEIFQTAALVHDDIIDESDMRRGKPSAHRALAAAASSQAIGTGLGIMLGDLLATASVSVAQQATRTLPNGGELVATFLDMHREVEFGQILDLAVEEASLDDPEALATASLDVFRWKTASYTTIAPIRLALLAVGLPAELAREQALAIGEPLGLAFQLADDLLDVAGSPATTGKPVGGDIREGKRTVLLADALTAADESERNELKTAYLADSRDEETVSRVRELFDSTGAIAASRLRIAALWERSLSALDRLEADETARDTIRRACAKFVPADLR